MRERSKLLKFYEREHVSSRNIITIFSSCYFDISNFLYLNFVFCLHFLGNFTFFIRIINTKYYRINRQIGS